LTGHVQGKVVITVRFITLGNFYAFVYLVMMALSAVWVNRFHQVASQPLMLGVVSLAAILFYNAIERHQLARVYRAILRFPILWLAMSVFFALTWGLIFYASIHASPRAAIVIFYLVVAVLGYALDYQRISTVICFLALAGGMYLLPELTLQTATISVLAGVCGYLYMWASGRYAQQASLSATQVLAVRFYVLLLGSVVACALSPVGMHVNITLPGWQLIASFVLLIFFNLTPNFCAQQGIILMGANQFAKVTCWTPVFTFGVQGLFEGVWDIKVFCLCLSVSSLLALLTQRFKADSVTESVLDIPEKA
jgi:hypothetical protein